MTAGFPNLVGLRLEGELGDKLPRAPFPVQDASKFPPLRRVGRAARGVGSRVNLSRGAPRKHPFDEFHHVIGPLDEGQGRARDGAVSEAGALKGIVDPVAVYRDGRSDHRVGPGRGAGGGHHVDDHRPEVVAAEAAGD